MAASKTLSKPIQKQIRVPVPTAGINSHDNVMALGVNDAYAVTNMIPKPTGLEVRKGYKEHLSFNYTFAAALVTLMYYDGANSINNKLFAVLGDANSSIYDVSTPNVVPALSVAPGVGALVPGECSWVNYRTPATSYLCVVLPGKGYYTYTAAAGWVLVPPGAGAGQIQFIYNAVPYASSDMTFCFTWKNRLWFLHAGANLAWYLPVNQVTGVATAIDLGQFLVHGGELSIAFGWTYDSGSGMDDNLVFVGSNGDLIIYQGSDPAVAASFALRGTWYIGRIPAGKRGYCQYGGDVVLITEYGVVTVSELVSGKILIPEDQTVVGGKFNPTLSEYISTYINSKYWQIISYPSGGIVYVASPALDASTTQALSFCMNHFAKSWSIFTDFPASCCVVYGGVLYFGTATGILYEGLSGYRDNASYDGVQAGNEVTGYFQPGFYDYGFPDNNKRAQRIRLLGISDGTPGYVARIVDEYYQEPLLTAPVPAAQTGALWDVALWDDAVWQSRASTFKAWFGVAGVGKKLSAQIAVRGLGYTMVTDYEVTFEVGNGL